MRKLFSLGMALFMACFCILTTGCSSEVQKTVNTAEAVLESAGNILSASNPADGAMVMRAAADFKEIGSLLDQYDKSVAAGKPGIATQIQAVTGTLQANLQTILGDVNVHNPELVEYITVAVAIANGVVSTIVANLPQAPPGATVAQSAVNRGQLPVIQFKTHKDLANYWNGKVKDRFPKAMVK